MRPRTIAAVLVLWPSLALAVLLPEAYERLKREAPLAFTGVVLDDPGGAARIQVRSVERGPLQVGAVVVVSYPENHGQEIPVGGDYWYRRYGAGDVLRVWARESAPGELTIVPAGIEEDRKGPPPPPLRRTTARRAPLMAGALLVALLAGGAWVIRRLRSHRSPSAG